MARKSIWCVVVLFGLTGAQQSGAAEDRVSGLPPESRQVAIEYVATMYALSERGVLTRQEALWGACWSVLRAGGVDAYRQLLCGTGEYAKFPPMPDKLAVLNARLPKSAQFALPLKTPATHPHLFAHLLPEAQVLPSASQAPVQQFTASGTPMEAVGGPYEHWNGGAAPGVPPMAPPSAGKSLAEVVGTLLFGLGAALVSTPSTYSPPPPPPPVVTPTYFGPYTPVTPNTASPTYRVNGYVTSRGTYVAPYYRTYPDGNPYNNLSTPRRP